MFTPTFDKEWLQKKNSEGNDDFINAGGERTELIEKNADETSHNVSYSQLVNCDFSSGIRERSETQ